MGRSTSSCFKIITCGSDSADQNDLDLSESKGSHDKRGWSFRKRSAQHRVLSNTVTSEAPSSGNKESPESANLNSQPQIISSIPEKPSVPQSTDEKPKLSVPVEAKVVDTIVVTKSHNNADVQWDESVIIVLQTAVRRFMAQREILRLRNVVKLQAAVRGHLVRRRAVGSLRCIQAICKMQALVRARQARGSLKGSYKGEKFDGKDGSSLKSLGKENIVTYTSLEKLLSNRFAQQLLDSTPKDRPIHIKCDPLKPNSAWIWLERWMSSAQSPDPSPAPSPVKEPELIAEEQQASKDEKCPPQVEAEIPSEVISKSADLKSNDSEVVLSSESDENLITYEAENFKFQTGHLSSSSSRDSLELPQPEITSSSDMRDSSVDINQPIHSDVNFQTELEFLPSRPEMCTEQPKQSMKPLASEERETETKKSVSASKKASNPAFIAAQTKFEVLSSTANSGRSVSLDVGVEPGMDTVSSMVDTVFRAKDIIIAENTAPNNPRVQVGGSECGTELSISSTLDSPDISEAGVTEYEHEAKVSEGNHNPNIMQKHELGAKDALDITVSNLSQPASDQPEKREDITDASVTSIVIVDSLPVNQKPESTSDLQQEVVLETSHHAYKSSPEASPRSHMTVPESQGTPSSQVSVKPKRSKANKSGSNRKPKSMSSAKGSPSSINHDSGARSSTEQLPSDQKGGKRRNSFGSVKPDQVDQEPRDSSSSLPHFMQATQSARAKLNANNSPRSSPDMQDTDLYIKKRHSLPGTNGRQGSPRIQRSMSQAQQGAKGNGTNSNERKWQR